MIGLVLFAATLGQFVESPEFPRALQVRAVESTVRVFQPALRGEGSGVVVKYEAGTTYILTAHHVVPAEQPNADLVEITFFPQGKPPFMLKGQVSARMTNEDLAVIVVRMKQAPPGVSPICPKTAAPDRFLKKPLPVLTVGMGPLATPEVIVDHITEHKLVSKPDGSQAFHWEAGKSQAIGRSGGPLLDAECRVIGICSGTKSKKGYYISVYEFPKALSNKGFAFLVGGDSSDRSQDGSKK